MIIRWWRALRTISTSTRLFLKIFRGSDTYPLTFTLSRKTRFRTFFILFWQCWLALDFYVIGSVESYTRISISATIYASMHILPIFLFKKGWDRSRVRRSMGFGCRTAQQDEVQRTDWILKVFFLLVERGDGLNIIIFIFLFLLKHLCLYSADGGLWDLVQHPWKKTS